MSVEDNRADGGRFRGVQALYHDMMARPAHERASALAAACPDDPELAAEVQLLLDQPESAADPLARPAVEMAADLVSGTGSSLIGRRIGVFEIQALLGVGGMGEVYRARDTRLGRDVAIKALPADKLTDGSRHRRFIQEARAASALNHPNIVTIHEIESAEGIDFIVMELVSGATLGELIRRGMKLRDVLRIAIPVADALARAHAAGIVHRDLKPANVMIGDDGTVKVLDFGLAKLIETERAGRDREGATATAQSSHTGPGMTMGTPGYMSPEQASGGKIDARSDVFAFGALLYEMATGRRAFAGSSAAETLARVLTTEPAAPSTVARGVPPDLERLILRCLRKEPEKRAQHMADVKVQLEEIREGLTGGAPAPRSATTARRRWLAVGFVVTALLVVTGGALRRRTAPPAPSTVVPVSAMAGTESFPTVSPDGTQVAFSWEGEGRPTGTAVDRDIWVKLVNGTGMQRKTSGPDDDWNPSWSPDGSQIAFLRFAPGSTTGGTVYVVSVLGDTERRVGDFESVFSQISWSADGRWIAVGGASPSGIHLIPATGGESHTITTAPQSGYDTHPAFSPDGRRLAYVSCISTGRPKCQLMVADFGEDGRASGARRLPEEPVENFPGLAWTRDGRSIVYAKSFNYFTGRGMGSRLWRVAADGSSQPERIELAPVGSFAPSTSRARDTLFFTLDRSDYDIYGLEPGGLTHPVIASSFLDYNPRFSPDGRRIAFESSRFGDTKNIWTADPDGSHPVELTRPPGIEGSPAWSPDGKRIVFLNDRTGEFWIMDADGASPRRLTEADPARHGPPIWSRDGRWIYGREDRTDGRSIVRIPVAGGPPERIGKSGPLIMVEESPDGKALFLTRREATGPLFSLSLSTGVERQVEECVFTRAMASTASAFYYVGCPEGRLAPVFSLDPATGRRRLLGKLDREGVIMGLTVSTDEKRILYGREVPWSADLMMIENFR